MLMLEINRFQDCGRAESLDRTLTTKLNYRLASLTTKLFAGMTYESLAIVHITRFSQIRIGRLTLDLRH
jgi:hypothetical protein